MRIMIKGGVWKNTEDEILKAAVMKYGLNQWARISSLLVRKSAKQCKARWYEWLDPAIKKTEWTREEDEKLLHLAKLMPTQWRTIAPIVGRTPAQCLERYEKLLDMAASKDENYDPADDPRRLRPGEIDPNPEAKPARPDPIDMDEDEKEMLSEARARLANTRGKKAKRKAREKQLEEARRLASLQKKRELKAAGIELRERNRRKRGVDYSKEIAFEKKPTIGFYDTGEEQALAKEMTDDFRPVTLEELEGKRRKDIEQGLMKQDVDRQKIRERHDQPGALEKASELNDPQMMRRRGKLMLPAPQVSEQELMQIARAGTAASVDEDMAGGAGGTATRALLGDYNTPARMATPLRTPRLATAGGKDRVLQEAENLARLQQTQTPLLGGENPHLNPSDFTGITPRAHSLQTPNPLAQGLTPSSAHTPSLAGATPSRRAIGGIAATPGATPGALGPGATPLRTPLRDELGLNDPDALVVADNKREERARQAMIRNELMAGLNQLPAPRGQYEIEVPELPEDEEMAGEGVEEDAADRDARLKAAEAARIEAELRKRPMALQRNLPRPVSLHLMPDPTSRPDPTSASLLDQAKELLLLEMSSLLHRDALKYPIQKKKKEKRRKRGEDALLDLEDYPEEDLKAAASLVDAEVSHVRQAMGHDQLRLSDYADTWDTCLKEFMFVPSQQRYGKLTSVTNSDRVASIQADFDGVRKEMEKEAQRAAKLEDKVKTVTAGFMQREARLRAQGDALWQSLQKANEELGCFQALREQEQRAAPNRLEMLQDMLAVQKEKEEQLQGRYKMLFDEQDDLLRQLRAPATEVA